ncbi:hypothetical protein B296_00047802 [Ensete ventricosum]|uniref:Uncharacterized protein n=1 Tax=Ensete ventricosum TaxID=4639 RepID=A0A426YHB0_ENSVE|nr:hypothetical protein B296_00047802 [Ensete ventricosum]
MTTRVAAARKEAKTGGSGDWRQVAAVRVSSNGDAASRGGDWRGAVIVAGDGCGCGKRLSSTGSDNEAFVDDGWVVGGAATVVVGKERLEREQRRW